MLCVLYVRMCAREFMDVMDVCNVCVCYMYVYILHVCMFYVNCVGKSVRVCMYVMYECYICMYVMYVSYAYWRCPFLSVLRTSVM